MYKVGAKAAERKENVTHDKLHPVCPQILFFTDALVAVFLFVFERNLKLEMGLTRTIRILLIGGGQRTGQTRHGPAVFTHSMVPWPHLNSGTNKAYTRP